MSTNYAPSPFKIVDFRKIVENELKEDRVIIGLLLIHGFIEAYLRECLFIMGSAQKDEIAKEINESIQKISFGNLISINAMLGNVDDILYGELIELNRIRNNFAHDLIFIDLGNEKNIAKIKGTVSHGIKVCGRISRIYNELLENKGRISDEEFNREYHERLMGLVDDITKCEYDYGD